MYHTFLNDKAHFDIIQKYSTLQIYPKYEKACICNTFRITGKDSADVVVDRILLYQYNPVLIPYTVNY